MQRSEPAADGILAARSGGLAAAERLCTAAADRIAFAGVIGILAIALLMVGDVLLRWLANAPIGGLNEIVQLAMAVAISATFPAGVMRRANLSLDLLTARASPWLKLWLPVVGDVALLALFVVLAWHVGLYAVDLGVKHVKSVYLLIPQAPVVAAVTALLAVAAAFQALALAVRVRDAAAGAGGTGGPRRAADVVIVVLAVFAIVALALGVAPLARAGLLAELAGLAFALLWVFALLQIPLGAVMALVGLLGTAQIIGTAPSFAMLSTEMTTLLMSPQLGTLPLFLMMGSLAVTAGLSKDIYDIAHAVLGHLRGGLALVTIGSCAGFGTLTGMSLATSVTVGRITLPEMRRHGYSADLATGCVAAGGTLGQLVPPSTALILYALLTEGSIGKLFVAAIVPAGVAVALYLATVALYVRFVPGAAPARAERSNLRNLANVLRTSWPVVALFMTVLGGIYGGVFTETEAAAVGVVATFAIAVLRGRLSRGAIWNLMGETVATTAMIYILIVGAQTISFFVGITGMPEALVKFVEGLDLQPLAVIGILLVIYTILGMIMDSFTVMVISVPIVAPLITGMGYDLTWWGIIMLVVVETGMISPPFGLNVFVLKGLAPDVPMQTVFKGVTPFVCADLLKLAMLVLLPGLALWLPSTMMR